jgi:hypothetical protein
MSRSAPSKYDKLFAVFESFSASLASLPDEKARQLAGSWEKAKASYAELLASDSGVTKSKIAVGLEQGLRETPRLLQRVASPSRAIAIVAFHSAVKENYPEFFLKQEEALAKVLSRGTIRTEGEFYLVRAEIDRLEGSLGEDELLRECYGLVERFEQR